jgi:phosphatidylglycerophosphatase A
MNRLFLTFFYTGLSPYAPGTVGSVAALAVGLLLLNYIDTTTLFLLTILITVASLKYIDRYIENGSDKDPKEIVIDEVAGMWLALCIITLDPLNIVLAFLFFRLYDIKKPSVIGRIDRSERGGISVMGDDLLAGFFAGVSAEIVVRIIESIQGLV